MGLGEPGDVIFYPAQRTHPGRLGAAIAHRNILLDQVKQRKKYVLVLEDDVFCQRPHALRFMRQFLESSPWDILYLGGQANPKNGAEIIGEDKYTFQVRGMTGGFAIVYGLNLCETVLPLVRVDGHIKGDKHFDRLIEELVSSGQLIARCPKHLPYAHAIIGNSDTPYHSRWQGLTPLHHRVWFSRMKRKWKQK